MTRDPIGKTTYVLVYGSKAVALVEVALPTARVSMHNPNINKQMRSLDFGLLEERRIASRLKVESYKQKTKMSRDKRVVRRPLGVGDWVLRKIEGIAIHIKENKLTSIGKVHISLRESSSRNVSANEQRRHLFT